jgi:hypothetical protein
MKWVTRKHIHVNRTATAWLIRRFLDTEGEIQFVEPEQVAEIQQREGSIGFDAPGVVTYPHRDPRGRCSFEALVAERLPEDAALQQLGKIVHGADFPAEMEITRESAGLWAISQGFTDVGKDDAEILEKASFLYDALYSHLQRQVSGSSIGKGGRQP